MNEMTVNRKSTGQKTKYIDRTYNNHFINIMEHWTHQYGNIHIIINIVSLKRSSPILSFNSIVSCGKNFNVFTLFKLNIVLLETVHVNNQLNWGTIQKILKDLIVWRILVWIEIRNICSLKGIRVNLNALHLLCVMYILQLIIY